MTDTDRIGAITLVGAGPGDPDLITVAGARALAEAELVIYDRLAGEGLLDLAPRAERVYAGKRPGERHAETQRRINALMVEEALAGRRVVRLKGGDPMVFGRGGEELSAALAHGVPIRVIPGVTAALGAAAAAQIPLTHRDVASSVAFVTGCTSEATGGRTDWRALAAAVDTIVIYMGAGRLPWIAGELLAGGRPADQPALIVERATRTDQRISIWTLGALAAGEAEGRIEAPALVVAGEGARLDPAAAARLAVTKPVDDAAGVPYRLAP